MKDNRTLQGLHLANDTSTEIHASSREAVVLEQQNEQNGTGFHLENVRLSTV